MKTGTVSAAKAGTEAMDGLGRSVDRVTSKMQGAASASQSMEERNRKITDESDKADAGRAALNPTAADNTGLDSLKHKFANGTLNANDLATAQAVYDASKANLTTYQQNSTSYSMEDAASAQGGFNAARNLLAQVKALVGAGAAPAQSSGGNYSITVTLPNGSKSMVNAASDSYAQALVAILSQLGDAQRRAA